MLFKTLILIAAIVTAENILNVRDLSVSARDLVPNAIDGDEEMFIRSLPEDHPLVKRATADSCKASSNGPPAGLPSIYPKATGTRSCSAPITVSGVFDGGLQRYDRGAGFRGSNNCLNIEPGTSDTIFLLNNGATLKNVIIGQEVKDSVYCLGSCTLENVWFEKTCEDSWSAKNPTSCSSCVMSWSGGAISGFTDKGTQHNGGGTMKINNVDVFFSGTGKGKLYRSCGGCGYPTRHVEITNVRVHSIGEAICGINADKGDTCTIRQLSLPAEWNKSDQAICEKWPNHTHDLDGKSCAFSLANVSFGGSSPAPGPAPATTKAGATTKAATTKAATTKAATTKAGATTKAATTTKASGGGSGCAALYGQCGGAGWNGAKCCSSGSCKVSNAYYSQCL